MAIDLTAATRVEKLLDNIAGGDNEVTPATRLEKFLSNIADAMEGGGSGGGGDFQFIIDPQYYDDENPSNNVYIYDTQNQRWNIFIPQAFLCVLPDNYDSSKFTFIGSVSSDGYNVYYMPVYIHLTTEATESEADTTAGAYIKSENPIYGYSDGQGNSYCFIPADAVVEYGTPK